MFVDFGGLGLRRSRRESRDQGEELEDGVSLVIGAK
jgi:hypothetical protein